LKGDYKYIANRYNQERIEIIKAQSKDNLAAQMTYTDGHIGVGTRGMKFNPEYLEYDQLYKVAVDLKEKNNLAKNPEYAQKMKEMKAELTKHLEPFNRPYGEFIAGPGAVAPGQIDEQIASLKAHILAGGYVGKKKPSDSKKKEASAKKKNKKKK
jgi:hypothetical protein